MNTKLLKEICETPGAPGYENRIRDLVLREVTSMGLRPEVDNMGNVTVLVKGKKDRKIMVGAHMDEIGFMVTHIDDKGFVRFTTLGGFDPKTLTAQRVLIHGKADVIGVMGSKPIHLMSPEEREKPVKIGDFFIDTGLPADEVKSLIEVGNVITREREFIQMGPCFNCKSLDNRISVFILLEAIRNIGEIPYDLYAVFTVQEEVGIRGAQVATLRIQPDFGFGLDTTIAYDVPGSKEHEQVTRLGAGAGIKIMDSSVICDSRMVAFMKNVADRNEIKWQPEILTGGGTDTSGIQRMTAGGAIAGAVSIPTRHIHQVIEMVHSEDVANSINLLQCCIREIDRGDW
ncbi:MAG: M42 family metallopeptidase [Bacteroidetes bacterium]|nr:M42 family metallopeptidase [Bacteroidota bacterium]